MVNIVYINWGLVIYGCMERKAISTSKLYFTPKTQPLDLSAKKSNFLAIHTLHCRNHGQPYRIRSMTKDLMLQLKLKTRNKEEKTQLNFQLCLMTSPVSCGSQQRRRRNVSLLKLWELSVQQGGNFCFCYMSYYSLAQKFGV